MTGPTAAGYYQQLYEQAETERQQAVMKAHRLERWRNEALEVIDQWDEVYTMVEGEAQLGEAKAAVVARVLTRLLNDSRR